MGVRCKDGVVLAVEKILPSPMMVTSSDKKVQRVASHLAVVSGMALCVSLRTALHLTRNLLCVGREWNCSGCSSACEEGFRGSFSIQAKLC